jgi:hypothetical protein
MLNFYDREPADVIARVFGQNGRPVNTGDDVRQALSALRRDPRKRVC